MNTDRIEKNATFRESRSRVWQALTDSTEFGRWFGIEFNGPFAPGAELEGKVTIPGYEHLRAEVSIDRMEPEWLFAFRWHPAPVDPERDYSREPTTLVAFQLSDVIGGTKLTLTESGFDRLPLERRDEAYRENESGWTQQIASLTRYLTPAA